MTTLAEKREVLIENLLVSLAEAGDIPMDTPAVPTRAIELPTLSMEEIQASILGCSNTAPGSDEITSEVLRHAWPLIADHVYSLFNSCLSLGYHPRCFRQAILIMIPKPNKSDFSSPRSYHPIALLSVLGKGLERLLAKRIAWISVRKKVLASQQFGALPGRSAVDLTTCLTHDVERALNEGRTATLLTLDVKGAFDAVLPGRLARCLREQGWPESLVKSVSSFATGRSVQIRLDGETGPLQQVNCGLPQGSPASPILFMLYISPIFKMGKISQRFSYADDIALIETRDSLQENCGRLTASLQEALAWGRGEGITFDPGKTELQHFSRRRADKDPNSTPSINCEGFSISENASRPYTRWFGGTLIKISLLNGMEHYPRRHP